MSDLDHGRLIGRLRRLVSIDSSNPGAQESTLSKLIETELRDIGAEVSLVEALPGRPSVAAVLDSGMPGPRLVLNGHMDTVPVGSRSGWSCDPFGGEIRDGLLFGRGACDMKAGLSAQIAVAEAIRGQLTRGSLILHFAIGEERAEPGTSSLLAAGFGGDFGVVTEPTSLEVAVAQRGATFIRVSVTGRGGHGARPDLAVNPITHLPAVLAEVDAYIKATQRQHPLLGRPTCTPTIVRAGETPNVVPHECTVVLDRRLLPGELAADELDALSRRLAFISRMRDLQIALEPVGAGFEPCETPSDSPIARALVDAVGAVRGRPARLMGTPFASDVRNLVLDAEMDAVTFGPGSIDQAHRPNEYVSVREVSDAAEILLRVARSFLT